MTFAQPDTQHWGGNRDIERDNFGRPLIVPPGGGKPKAYTRCTTFVDALSDKSNLMAWKARMAALGLARSDDLMLQIAGHDPDDKKGLDRLVDQAANLAGASRGANIGTQIHEATEKYDRGEELPPLGKFQADVDAYIQATRGLEVAAVEQFRVHDDLHIGGTADRLFLIDGKLTIADIKTGGLWDVGKMAMQLAVYANSVPYNPETNTREVDPHPVDTTRGLLIHLPEGKGTCDLYWLNLQVGMEAVHLAAEVRRWRRFHKNKATRQEVIVDCTPEEKRAFAG